MSWKSGSYLAELIVKAVRPRVPDDARVELYVELIDAFEEMDCDTLYHLAEGSDADPAFVEAFKRSHPDGY